MLGDSWNFVCRKHDSQAEQHIVGEGQQSEKQQCCLHKRRQAQRGDLLHPLIEAVGVASGHAEHVERTHRHLHQQYAASRDVLKEDFHDAVRKGNHAEEINEAHADVSLHSETALEYACADARKSQPLLI